VITGASQGMGAALVEAYRHLDYGVVATARSIGPSNDDQVLMVHGDINRPEDGRACDFRRRGPVRNASIRSSTTRAYSSPSRSLSTRG